MSGKGTRGHALVTGGSRRVGRAIALSLGRAGCDVTITYNRSSAEAARVVGELNAMGVRGAALQLSLDDTASVDARVDRLAGSFSRLDVLVHNASTYELSPLAELDAGRVARDYAVNALGPLLLSARLAPLLSASALAGGGAIVALCDVHALGRPRRKFASYSMSKAALVEMVRTLARELAPRVRVNGIAPGVVAWPESGRESTGEERAAYLSRVPLGRAGTAEEASEVCRWLALDAHYVTGEIVRVDGGRWLA